MIKEINMYKNIITIAALTLIGCEESNAPKREAQTFNQVETLRTECDDNHEIDLTFDGVYVINITHDTGGFVRAGAEWAPAEESDGIYVQSCGEAVEVTYMYK
jgi:hypothetical protein